MERGARPRIGEQESRMPGGGLVHAEPEEGGLQGVRGLRSADFHLRVSCPVRNRGGNQLPWRRSGLVSVEAGVSLDHYCFGRLMRTGTTP